MDVYIGYNNLRLILSENGIRASWCQNTELNHSRLCFHGSVLLEALSSSNEVSRSALPPSSHESLTQKKMLLSQKPVHEQNIQKTENRQDWVMGKTLVFTNELW